MKDFKFEENNDIEKIKVTSAEIVVHGNVNKPYYEIKYYPIDDGECHIGYSSYDLKMVFNWLEECFDVVRNSKKLWIVEEVMIYEYGAGYFFNPEKLKEMPLIKRRYE